MELTGDPVMIGLQIALTGVSIVFLALVLVSLSLYLVGIIDRGINRINQPKPAEAPAPAAVTPVPASTATDQIEPEVMAVLSAAVIQAIGRPARITRIRSYNHPLGKNWSLQGRVTIMASRPRVR
jgi:Na+-transporting methylmalonyl-CoA/oxaloacetate decarboxylase gamma subunit